MARGFSPAVGGVSWCPIRAPSQRWFLCAFPASPASRHWSSWSRCWRRRRRPAVPPSGRNPERAIWTRARRAATWVRSVAVTTPKGRDWPPDPRPRRAAANPSLYAGTPGVVLFFLELARATGDRSYLDDAARGALTVMASATSAAPYMTTAPARGAGLWEGLAGSAFVLQETGKATGDRRFTDAAMRVTDTIVRQAKTAGAGVEWSDTTDIISGSAGTGLYLLYAAREFNQPALTQLAGRAGLRLIELARKEGTGLKWAMDPKFPRLMPNFSHGTAGIAYFLAALYEETRDRRFLDAAVAGARYLQSVAKTEGDVCLVFHNEPDGKDLYYLGWCHGPVGTARLFFRLYQVTEDREWLTWVQKSAQALRASGIPEARTPGFWNNVGQCCGSAGVADFFLALWRETGDARDLAFARRMIDDMLGARDAGGRRVEVDPGGAPLAAEPAHRADRLHAGRGRHRLGARALRHGARQAPGGHPLPRLAVLTGDCPSAHRTSDQRGEAANAAWIRPTCE